MKCRSRTFHRGRELKLESLEQRRMLTTIFVTDDSDAGPGTFRQAIIDASADAAIHKIVFRKVDAVVIESTVAYTGGQSLAIDGKGATIEGNDFDLLVSNGGGDLSLSNLTFQDGANGVYVQVPAEAEGVLSVMLRNVVAENNDGFGVKISDQGDGAPAGIRLDVSHSRFTDNGKDGLRVEDRGDGDLYARVANATITGNDKYGVKVEQGDDGSGLLVLQNVFFSGNGKGGYKAEGVDVTER